MAASPSEAATVSTSAQTLRLILSILVALAIPLLLVSTNIRWLTEDRALYLDGYSKYGVSEHTGLSPGQLEQVTDTIIAYFKGPPGRLDVNVELGGVSRPLFNEREILHMVDVQFLVHGVQRMQLASGGAIVAILVIGFALWRQNFLGSLGVAALAGAGLTLALLALVGIFSLVDFHSFFWLFHLVSFPNDLWILDPRRDYLIMLYPLGFWFDTTVRLALMTAIGAIIVGAVGAALLKVPSLIR